jgi:hypothetical protein
MTSETRLDIRINSNDPAITEPIELVLKPLTPKKLEQHRDIGLVLTVVGPALGLADGIIALWRDLRHRRSSAIVVIEVETGATLELNRVESVEEVQDFVLKSH